MFNYQPPPGGDVYLRSNDGGVFLTHSQLLRLASSVFADTFATATQHHVIELDDDAESISLMLRFIYPPAFIEDLSLDLLEKSLRMAQRYNIGTLLAGIDHLIANRYLYVNNLDRADRDNVHIFCLAAKYGLPKTQKLSTTLIQPGKFVFGNPRDIEELAGTFPGAADLVKLLGGHCVRTQKLLDLLVGHGRENLYPISTTDPDDVMMCVACFDNAFRSGTFSQDNGRYRPQWLSCWLTLAIRDLVSNPDARYDKNSILFKAKILDEIKLEMDVCQDCIKTAKKVGRGACFKQWARNAQTEIETALRESRIDPSVQ